MADDESGGETISPLPQLVGRYGGEIGRPYPPRAPPSPGLIVVKNHLCRFAAETRASPSRLSHPPCSYTPTENWF